MNSTDEISETICDAQTINFLLKGPVNECPADYYYGSQLRKNTGNFQSCSCNQGFAGENLFCEDIDECTLETDECDQY